MALVKFANGEEGEYDADSAGVAGSFFVLSKYNPNRGKLQSVACFPAEDVAWVRVDGTIVLGRGVVGPAHSA